MIWYDIPTSFPYRDFDEKLIWISVAYLHDESKSILKWSKHFWGDFLSQEYKALMGNDYLDVVDVKTLQWKVNLYWNNFCFWWSYVWLIVFKEMVLPL